MATTTTIDVSLLDSDAKLGSVAQAAEEKSSLLNSYEGIPLDDLTDEQILFIATEADLQTIHKRSSQEVGRHIMKFKGYFEHCKPIVVRMKELMCAQRGSHRKTVVDGTAMTWAEYCQTYYGVSYQWVQKLLNGDYLHVPGEEAAEIVKNDAADKPPDVDAVQTEGTKLSKNDKKIAGLVAENNKLKNELEELRQEITASRPLAPEEKAEVAEDEFEPQSHTQGAHYDMDTEACFNAGLAYFKQVTNPLTFASDLDTYIRECGMSKHIKTVLTEAQAI